MKIPWDKQYLKISLHVAFTVAAIGFLYLAAANIKDILQWLMNAVGWIISGFMPLIIAFIIAYLLDGVVEFMQNKYEAWRTKRGKVAKKQSNGVRTRTVGTSLAYLILFLVLGLLGYLIYHFIGSELNNVSGLTAQLNNYVQSFNNLFGVMQDKLFEFGLLESVQPTIENISDSMMGFVAGLGRGIVDMIGKTGTFAVRFLLALVLAFYMLKEKEGAIRKCNELIDTFIPQQYAKKIRYAMGDIDAVFSGYVRGQLTDALIMAVLISVTLSAIGIHFPVIIGVVSGFSNLIPYFGAFVGFILAVLVGFFSDTPIKALYAGIAIIVLQQIDGTFIVPKVVGENVKLHPAVVLIAISVAATQFGLLGMVIAVPVVATCKMFLVRFIERKKRKKNKNKIKEDKAV